MAFDRFKVIVAVAAAVITALGLSACGRNGALEMPPGPAGAQPAPTVSSGSPASGLLPGTSSSSSDTAATPQETVAKTGFDAQGNPAASQGQKKPFILDPLLR